MDLARRDCSYCSEFYKRFAACPREAIDFAHGSFWYTLWDFMNAQASAMGGYLPVVLSLLGLVLLIWGKGKELRHVLYLSLFVTTAQHFLKQLI